MASALWKEKLVYPAVLGSHDRVITFASVRQIDAPQYTRHFKTCCDSAGLVEGQRLSQL